MLHNKNYMNYCYFKQFLCEQICFRYEILQKLIKNITHEIKDEDLRELANTGHGFVGADLVALCSQAGLHARKVKREQIVMEDFKFALTKVRPSAMREVQIEVRN